MEYYLRTEQLAVGYHGSALIENIGICLKKGRILTLIGPNGSGKSTLLKTITKHLESIAGTVYIGGGALNDMTNRELAMRASVVLTERLKTELTTCEEIVEAGRYPHTGRLGILSAKDKLMVKEAMALVNVTELAQRDFAAISDGQRQRVLLARAVCQQPEIIVLDEPTSFLDVRYELELLDILRKMARERAVAVVMSLHELDLAQRVSDDVLCVNGETVTYYGPADAAFTRERISALYGLEEGSYNPLFGSLEMRKQEGKPKTFVIAGGGAGIPVYRRLQKLGVPFASGVLHENDVDFQVASDLACAVVAQKAFERITDETFERALAVMRGCERVINCLTEYGEMNELNRVLNEKALALGIAQDDATIPRGV